MGVPVSLTALLLPVHLAAASGAVGSIVSVLDVPSDGSEARALMLQHALLLHGEQLVWSSLTREVTLRVHAVVASIVAPSLQIATRELGSGVPFVYMRRLFRQYDKTGDGALIIVLGSRDACGCNFREEGPCFDRMLAISALHASGGSAPRA